MTRRQWLYLSSLSLAACKEEPKAAPASSQASKDSGPLKAGPFSVTVPAEWRASAIVEKVPLHPLYSEEAWQAYKKDNSYVLKPYYACRPEHWAIRLPAALPKGIDFNSKDPDDDPTAPQILIHRMDQWSVAATDGKVQEREKYFTPEYLRQGMEGLLSGEGPSPGPGYMDGMIPYRCVPKRIDFDGGYGVRVISEWELEADLMTKGDLHYLFYGLSGDNSCQIIATFPIDLPGLPESDPPGEPKAEHLGRSMARYEDLDKNFEAYVADAEKWVALHQAEITPNLDTLDAMLRSLVVKSWA